MSAHRSRTTVDDLRRSYRTKIESRNYFRLHDTGKLCSKSGEDRSMNNVAILSTDAGRTDGRTLLSVQCIASIISKENLMFLFTRTSSTIQCLVCHPAGQYGPSTRLLPQNTSGDLLGRLIFQLTLRSSMTQLFPCLVPTCPDGSGAF